MMDELKASDLFERVEVTNIDPGTGVVDVNIDCSEEMYETGRLKKLSVSAKSRKL